MQHAHLRNTLDSYADSFMSKHGIPGMALAVAEHGRMIHAQGYGYRNVEEQLPAALDTVFGIASLTKSFTCAAAMKLQEQGKLSVDDPVIRYLPEFATPDRAHTEQIRVHHFMTHSTGIPPLPTLFYAMKRSMDADPSTEDYPDAAAAPLLHQGPIDSYEQLMAFMAARDYELLGPPGTQFSYCNDCFGLLGAIVERVGGMRFADYVEREILQPAGMEATSFELDKLPARQLTMPYAARKEEDGHKTVYPAPGWWEAPALLGTGFLRATAGDMMKYMEMYRNNGKAGNSRVLQESSVRQMLSPHIQTAPGKYYGYGFHLTKGDHGTTLVEHGGGLKAVSSRMCFIPEKGITGVVLSNLAEVPIAAVLYRALNLVQGLAPDARMIRTADYGIKAGDLDGYTGRYSSYEGRTIVFAAMDGKLVLVGRGQNAVLQPVTERDLFLLATDDEETLFRFIRNAQDEVIRLWMSNSSRQLTKVE
ncbi:MAG: serine hydrolase [Paenibacillaceae bacterium]|nr:serine hydrolase [Paenibacillaceae bacterium]